MLIVYRAAISDWMRSLDTGMAWWSSRAYLAPPKRMILVFSSLSLIREKMQHCFGSSGAARAFEQHMEQWLAGWQPGQRL